MAGRKQAARQDERRATVDTLANSSAVVLGALDERTSAAAGL